LGVVVKKIVIQGNAQLVNKSSLLLTTSLDGVPLKLSDHLLPVEALAAIASSVLLALVGTGLVDGRRRHLEGVSILMRKAEEPVVLLPSIIFAFIANFLPVSAEDAVIDLDRV
jgi:hypothetical protein